MDLCDLLLGFRDKWKPSSSFSLAPSSFIPTPSSSSVCCNKPHPFRFKTLALNGKQDWKHRCPKQQQRLIKAKISKFLHFDPAPPPGACDVPELRATIWRAYSQRLETFFYPNLKCCTLNISQMELWTHRQTHIQTDDPAEKYHDAALPKEIFNLDETGCH